MNDYDISVNDGLIEGGLGDDITVLETGALYSFESHDDAAPGSSATIRRNSKQLKGRTRTVENKTKTGTLTGEAGSNAVVESGHTFVFDGEGWEIITTGKNRNAENAPVIPFTADKMINGLITAPAQTLTLVTAVAMDAVDLEVSPDLEGDGEWSIFGWTADGVAALSGLSVVGGQITGTPADDAGEYYLEIEYREGTGDNKKATGRTIKVIITES